jgi:DNA-binding CsgD family transcriptional regulator
LSHFGKEIAHWCESTASRASTLGATTLNIRGQRHLTQRERDIVAAIATGYTNKDLAREFFLSEDAVRRLLLQLFKKLGVINRFELVVQAIGRGLISSVPNDSVNYSA